MLLGQPAHQLADRRQEAEVEHVVGLVQHSDLGLVQSDDAVVQMLDQPAWGRHQHVDTALQGADLRAVLGAAGDQRGRDPHELAEGAEAGLDLGRQLAGRGQHQHAAGAGRRAAALRQQAVEDRQCEGCGLACAGLGDAQHVSPLQRGGDGLRLDRRRFSEAGLFDSTQKGLGQAERIESGHEVLLSLKSSRCASTRASRPVVKAESVRLRLSAPAEV